jgi:hypothetical protein
MKNDGESKTETVTERAERMRGRANELRTLADDAREAGTEPEAVLDQAYDVASWLDSLADELEAMGDDEDLTKEVRRVSHLADCSEVTLVGESGQ